MPLAPASMTAARKVQRPDGAERQTPSPGLASISSAVLLTVRPLARADRGGQGGTTSHTMMPNDRMDTSVRATALPQREGARFADHAASDRPRSPFPVAQH